MDPIKPDFTNVSRMPKPPDIETSGFSVMADVKSLIKQNPVTEMTPMSDVPLTRYEELDDAAPSAEVLRSQMSEIGKLALLMENAEDPQAELEYSSVAAFLSEKLGVDPFTVRNDIEGFTEKYFGYQVRPQTAFKAIANAWTRGYEQFRTSREAQQLSLEFDFTPGWEPSAEQVQRLEELFKRQDTMPPPDATLRTWIGRQFVKTMESTLEQMPRMLNSMAESTVDAAVVAGGAFAAAALGSLPLYAGPQGIVTAKPAFASAAALSLKAFGEAYKVFSVKRLADSYAGSTFLEIMREQMEDGRRIDWRIAAASSQVAGALAGISEFVAISNIPGLDRVANRIGTEVLMRSFFRGVWKNRAANAVGRWAGSVGLGVVNEVYQETAQMIGVELSKRLDEGVHGGEWDRPYANEILDRYWQIIDASARSYAVMGLPGTVANIVRPPQSIVDARRTDTALKNIEDVRQKILPKVDLADPKVADLQAMYDRAVERLKVNPTPGAWADVMIAVSQMEELTGEDVHKTLVDTNIGSPEIGTLHDWQMDRQQYMERERLTSETLAETLNEAIPGIDPLVSRAMSAVIEQFAHRTGRSINQYLEGMHVRGVHDVDGFRAAFQPIVDRIAGEYEGVISLSQKADITSLVHELTHLEWGRAVANYRDGATNLTVFTEEDYMILKGWAKDIMETDRDAALVRQGVWSEDVFISEKVSEAMERYLANNELPTDSRIRHILNSIADFLKNLWEAVFSRTPELSQDVREVFDRVFSDEAVAKRDAERLAMAPQEVEIVLAQREAQKIGDDLTTAPQQRAVADYVGMYFQTDNKFAGEARPGDGSITPMTKFFINLAHENERLETSKETFDTVVSVVSDRMYTDLKDVYARGDRDVLAALDWYSHDVKAFRDMVTPTIPELARDEYWLPFLAITGFTSNGMTPIANVFAALGTMKFWLRTGKMPYGDVLIGNKFKSRFFGLSDLGAVGVAGGKRSQTFALKAKQLETVWEKLGRDMTALQNWLFEEHTGKEIQEMIDGKIGGMTLKEMYNGIEFLGPKTGQFPLALYGNEDYVVKDKWFVRYWNRALGTPFTQASMTVDKLRDLAVNYEKKKSEWIEGGQKGAAPSFSSIEFTTEAPRTKVERLAMEAAVNSTRERMAADGIELTNSQIQALLWNFEKKIYRDANILKAPETSYRHAGTVYLQSTADYRVDTSGNGFESRPLQEVINEVEAEMKASIKDRPVAYTAAWDKLFAADELPATQDMAIPIWEAGSLFFQRGEVSAEATPGTIPGTEWMKGMPYEVQQELLRDTFKALWDTGGIKTLAEAFGLEALELVETPGSWEGMTNPAMQVQVEFGEMTESTRDQLDSFAATLGLLLNQDGVGWNTLVAEDAADQATGVVIETGSVLSREATGKIDLFLNQNLGGMAVVGTPTGAHILNFSEKSPGEISQSLTEFLQQAQLIDGDVNIYEAIIESGLVENNWEEQKGGEGYKQRISEAGASAIFQAVYNDVGSNIDKAYQRYAEKYGPGRERTESPEIQYQRSILGSKAELVIPDLPDVHPGLQMANVMRKLGVKPEEMKWTGLDGFLGVEVDESGKLKKVSDAADRKVTRAELAEFMKANKFKLHEVIYAERTKAQLNAMLTAETEANYDALKALQDQARSMTPEKWFERESRKDYNYTTEQVFKDFKDTQDSGEAFLVNSEYIEQRYNHYINLPESRLRELSEAAAREKLKDVKDETKYKQYALPFAEEYRELVFNWDTDENLYESSHWPGYNQIAHSRSYKLKSIDGSRMFFVDEIQSDWRKDYLGGLAEQKKQDELIQSMHEIGESIGFTREDFNTKGLAGLIDKVTEAYERALLKLGDLQVEAGSIPFDVKYAVPDNVDLLDVRTFLEDSSADLDSLLGDFASLYPTMTLKHFWQVHGSNRVRAEYMGDFSSGKISNYEYGNIIYKKSEEIHKRAQVDDIPSFEAVLHDAGFSDEAIEIYVKAKQVAEDAGRFNEARNTATRLRYRAITDVDIMSEPPLKKYGEAMVRRMLYEAVSDPAVEYFSWATDEIHSNRWASHYTGTFYDKTITNYVSKLAKKFDTEIELKAVEDLENYDRLSIARIKREVPAMKLTQSMRESFADATTDERMLFQRGAWWFKGDAIYEADSTHIADILNHPERYGFTTEELHEMYKANGEKIGMEGKTREDVIKHLNRKNWVRVRHYSRPQDYWSLTVGDYKRQKKNIEDFIFYAIDHLGVTMDDQIQIVSTETNTMESWMWSKGGVRGFLEEMFAQRDQQTTSVEAAVAQGMWVEDRVLAEYAGTPWADAEMEVRHDLMQEALDFDTFEDFLDYVGEVDPEDAGGVYYQELWRQAQGLPRGVREISTQAWVDTLTPEKVQSFVGAMALSDKVMDIPHPEVRALARYVEEHKEAAPKGVVTRAKNVIHENPEVYRELFAEALADDAEIASIMLEEREDALRTELDRQIAKSIYERMERKSERRAYEQQIKKYENRVPAQEALKKRAEAQRERAYRKKMIRGIMKNPGNIAYEQAQKIFEIQSGYYVNKSARMREVENILREHVENQAQATEYMQKVLSMTKLSELSTERLEELFREIKAIRDEGRAKRMADLLEEKMEVDATVDSIVREVLSGDELADPELIGSVQSKEDLKSSIATQIKKGTWRPARIARMMNGGKEGIVYDLLVNKVNAAEDATLRMIDQRMEAGNQKMRELGIKAKTLGEIRATINGVDFTTDDIISVYIAVQNEDSARHLYKGNRISPEVAQELISKLTDEEIQWGEWMMSSFGEENYNRILSVLVKDVNKGMPRVDRYFPILSDSHNYNHVQQEAAADLMSRTPYSKQYASKKFTIGRKKGAQTPMRLGATAIWAKQVATQEKYINQGLLIKRLQRVFGNQDVRKAIDQKYGRAMNEWVGKYINDIANPDIYKSFDALSNLSRTLRSHAAMSYLGLNMVTMVKQLPSVAFYLPHTTPGYMLSSMAKFTANPKKMWERMGELDPQAKHRSISRFQEELKHISGKGYAGLVRSIGDFTMKGIQLMDAVAVTIGWNAVFDRAVAQGVSEVEAARIAQQATLDSQPAARAKDLAEIYRTHEGYNWFLMFSNQLNQIWNMLTADIPMAVRNREVGKLIGTMTGVALSATVIGWINYKDIPEDASELPEIAGKYLLDQLMSSIPIVGGSVKAGMEGWFGTGVDPFPLAGQAGRTARVLADADADGGRKADAVVRLLMEGMVASGLPTVQPRRIHDAFFAERWFKDPEVDLWELIGGLDR